ncbi:3-deoxy-D-manno-octulosonic acid transferase [Paracoccus aerodenitrificans]|uniref:3-deoxy-D-manno-octulosonic acid transferase n=1 Tax=Paracoccus aerodenitrificans TaxID=3017781 RepID=UPI0022EFDA78|nr:glycosyltransferase N-terminal domain-containing protein [Paracoccus aerodenitrificans]WBU65084.1 3-deoxy-D-manno-octulosonic acid transferase [Paracoccus aerodenitrificans]
MPYRSASWLAGAALAPFASGPLAERLVLDEPGGAENPQATGHNGTIWLHGASVGELSSARPVIGMLSAHSRLIVTANTTTGRGVARDWGFPARLAPLDTPQSLRRFLDRFRPRLAVTLENEMWPNRSAALEAAGIQHFVIGARMSERSARRWARLPWLIRPMLRRIEGLSAQDIGSEERLVDLGLPAEALMPRMQLKLLGPAGTRPQERPPTRDRTILAASTHEGEDGPVLDAFMQARRQVAGLRLIIAPRHTVRADDIAALMAQRGLHPARRSQGADETEPVLLADTMGEMDRWYDAAAICITGGSLVAKGGHTPWEPAAHECAILHGPHVTNFSEDYALLHAVDGAETLSKHAGATLAKLAASPELAARMGQNARRLLLSRAGDVTPLVERILGAADIAETQDHADITGMKGNRT